MNFKFQKVILILSREGLTGLKRRLGKIIFGDQYLLAVQKSYTTWYLKHYPTPTQLEKQKSNQAELAIRPLISILTPVYNPEPKFLIECIESVISQSYDNWELVLVDDASENPEVWKILETYAKKDSRIKIKNRSKNGHICRASNDALAMAEGKWISLLDHDDWLWPNALYSIVQEINQHSDVQFIYTDEDKISENGTLHVEPFFKPDWSPHFLRSINYITHFVCIQKDVVDQVGGFEIGTEGAQDWDLFLKTSNLLEAQQSSHPWKHRQLIRHIPSILYSWRKSPQSTSSAKHALAAKSYAYDAQLRVLQNDIDCRGGGAVCKTKYIGVLKVLPALPSRPLVSVIIPTKDNLELFKPCMQSLLDKTTYPNIELCIIDTGSKLNETINYYKQISNQLSTQVIHWTKPFNFSSVMNFGASRARGEYLMFLNDDTTIQTPSWIEQLLAFSQLNEVGAVGCRLLYPNGTIQHTGLVLGAETGTALGEQGFVSNYFRTARPESNYGIASLMIDTVRDYSAVTAAALMINRKKHDLIKGFDENLAIAFNDVDYCLKLQQKFLYNIVIPDVVFTHFESASLGKPGENQRDLTLLKSEMQYMKRKWGDAITFDPYFQNLTLRNALVFPNS